MVDTELAMIAEDAAAQVFARVGGIEWWAAMCALGNDIERASVLHFAAWECFRCDDLKRPEYTRAGYALLACVNVLADNYPDVWAPIARLRAEKV